MNAPIASQKPSFLIPLACDYDPELATASTLSELLNIEFLKSWTAAPGFHQFSHSFYANDCARLFAEFDQGKKWWVIAHLTGSNLPEIISPLPKWKGGHDT